MTIARRVRARRAFASKAATDGGFTLIEMMVALMIIAIVATSFLSLVLTAIRVARTNEARTQAVQLAQDRLEKVVAQPWSAIGLYAGDNGFRAVDPDNGESTVVITTSPRPASVPVPLPTTPTVLHGVSYTLRTDITWEDSPGDGVGVADLDGNRNDVKHVTITVGWLGRSLTVDDIRSPTASEKPPSGGSSLTVSVSAPSTAQLTTAGNLFQAMSLTATTSKVATGATLSFATRNGTQSVTMTTTNGTTWAASLPTSTGPFDTGLTTFGVSVTSSAGSASGNAKVNLVIGTAGANLSVTAAPSQQLNANGSLGTPIAVTATGVTSITSGTVSYPTSTGTVTNAMTGGGTSWNFQVPASSAIFNPGQETFTVQASFADGTSGTGLVTVSLFAGSLPPAVQSLTVVDPYGKGVQSFCVKQSNYSLFSATDIVAVVANVASTDTVRLAAPDFNVEFPMSYVKTNGDGTLTFHYSVPAGQQFPSGATSIVLKAYAVKTISGVQYRDDYVTNPAPGVQATNSQSSCL